ncbi:MAG: relaxase/mobilization nuclease domain-containing protein [Lachnospiraceae bacterium]
MAATRLISLHLNKGKTLAQCLAERTDYSQNPEKTEGGKWVRAYECDPMTADEEFLLSKRQYQQITGRSQERDVIAYQIRQSFKPGEVTPEEANQIGYELALQFTKGRHAFLVATHVDRAHIHNHIVFNSTSLDCSRKFRDFRLSGLALQRVSDRICLEHGLSIITPRPYSERSKRTVYPKKKTHRETICAAIDAALEKKPENFEALLALLEEAGYEWKRGKYTAVRGKGQNRFIRFRSLGEGYTEEDLRAVLEGKKAHHPKSRSGPRGADKPFDLLIDIQEKLNAEKGTGYERWAKVFNLKQMAQVLCFLQEQGIHDYEELVRKTDQAAVQFEELSVSIKQSEKRLAEITTLKKHIINYSKTRDVYVAYRKAGYSKKFLEAHREEITLHKAAKEAFEQLQLDQIPRIKELSDEYTRVLAEKKQAYSEYRNIKKEMREWQIARKNVELMLEKESTEIQKKQKCREMQL